MFLCWNIFSESELGVILVTYKRFYLQIFIREFKSGIALQNLKLGFTYFNPIGN